ncbi:C4-dicarboxylate ABC transporter [Bordetella bronchiseptica]|nr:C4-dicarboxylate ABC transporter [Bordetella bronchiseptica]AWQ12029.1 C4-dicarboxylate ABC transporter [Bordetella bronchiseptica]AXT87629.1 C4-dicarboxylate ABC transporter [Bordetella bronchiseptica]
MTASTARPRSRVAAPIRHAMQTQTGLPAALPPAGATFLAGFPVSMFASVLGLSGLGMAWRKAHQVWGLPLQVALAIQVAVAAVYGVLLALFLLRLLRHPDEIAREWNHPVQLAFFSAISLGVVLIGTAWADDAPRAAAALWWLGATVHLGFTLIIVRSWIFHTHYQLDHVNPSWFVPVVGNIVIPIAGVRFAPAECAWFFFSLGIVFWIVLKAIILYRLMFGAPLARALTPTLFIMIAPPAVAFLAYMALTGSLDGFARVLYYISLFWTLLLSTAAPRFARLPFSLAAWSYSFPLAAITLATFSFAEHSGHAFVFHTLAGFLVAVLSTVLVLLTGATVRGLLNGALADARGGA